MPGHSMMSTFFLCSLGWVKAVFTEALGEEVEVDLVQAIGRGMGVVSSWSIPDLGACYDDPREQRQLR